MLKTEKKIFSTGKIRRFVFWKFVKTCREFDIGAKATILRFYGQIDLDAITEEDKKSSGYGPPVSLN